jgi:hypothetical protein
MSEAHAYIARLTAQTEEQLRAIIDTCVGAGQVFAGDPVRLSEPADFTSAAGVDLAGDFGHAYGARAEVRWRRADAGYDVLVLTEDEQWLPDGGMPIAGAWRVRPVDKERYVLQTGSHKAVKLIEYFDAEGGGATIFARYGEVQP